jgi:hypothetical protein
MSRNLLRGGMVGAGALRISYRLGMNCRKSSYILCYNVTINENG